MTAGRAVLAFLVLAGCASHRTAGPPPWEPYVGDGPLAVRRARWSDPGPRIYRALARDPDTRAVVRGRGEPDTVRVVCGRQGRARVVLTYAAGRRREVVAEPDRRASTACAPVRPVRATVATRPSATVEPGEAAPSARQQLECPIDPTRRDCRALCTADTAFEWCR